MAILFAALLTGCSGARADLEAVPDLDLDRYAGTWYEVARLPNRFQDRCSSDVTARYELRDDGRIDVLNRCVKADGEAIEARGVARRASKDGPASILEVRFAPAFLGFLPAVWGDYQVFALDPDYRWAAVGEPRRRYLWILSRTPRLDEALLGKILETAASRGFDLEPLIRTPQSAAP